MNCLKCRLPIFEKGRIIPPPKGWCCCNEPSTEAMDSLGGQLAPLTKGREIAIWALVAVVVLWGVGMWLSS